MAKSLPTGKDREGNRWPLVRKGSTRRQRKVELDVGAWAVVTTLIIKHVFGPGKMEENLIFGLWVVKLLLFPGLHKPLNVSTSLPQCQAYQQGSRGCGLLLDTPSPAPPPCNALPPQSAWVWVGSIIHSLRYLHSPSIPPGLRGSNTKMSQSCSKSSRREI